MVKAGLQSSVPASNPNTAGIQKAGIQKEGVEKQFLELCEKTLGKSFRVVDVDCHIMGRSLLRVFVERVEREENGQTVLATGTGLEDCAEASRLLDAALEAEPLINGVITGRYDLEVSSPGLDRRMRTRADFEKHLGGTFEFRFFRKLEELGLGAKTTGELLGVEELEIRIKASGNEYSVPWKWIRQANIKGEIERSLKN